MTIVDFLRSPPGIIGLIFSVITAWVALRIHRRVRVLVHRAFFVGNAEPYYFVCVTNLSRVREVEITHVWFAADPTVIPINPGRSLPKRLKVDEQWATWVRAADLPQFSDAEVYELGRVRLSSGKEIKSKPNKSKLIRGQVPGSPSSA